ncbi:MAG TPA: GntR family transcriptional regulator [Clostridiales bacterium]|nr:GntR family transcriptional regulator [Clostridiales bacterium]
MVEKQNYLYEKIFNFIKRKIEAGEYAPGQQVPSEKELCSLFNVSTITAVRALIELERAKYIVRRKGSGSFVSSTDEINISREDTNFGEKMIALIVPFDTKEGKMFECVRGISSYLKDKDYYLTIHNSQSDFKIEEQLLYKMQKSNVRGVILYPLVTSQNVEVLNVMNANRYPIVTIDKYYDGVPISAVVADNFRGGYLAAEEHINNGHKRIAFVTDARINDKSSLRDRHHGYCQALVDHGISIDPELIVCWDNDYFKVIEKAAGSQEEIFKQVHEKVVLELKEKNVTAFCVSHDHLALRLMNLCSELGINIPDDLAIVGFDNIPMLNYMTPALTTIEQDFYSIGYTSAEILMDQIEGKNRLYTKEIIPVKFIEGESSCRKNMAKSS